MSRMKNDKNMVYSADSCFKFTLSHLHNCRKYTFRKKFYLKVRDFHEKTLNLVVHIFIDIANLG